MQLTVYDKCSQMLLIGPLKKLLKKFLTSLTIKPAKQLHGHTYSTGMLTFNWNILVKNAKNIFFKHFMIFFLRHNFECLIKTFHYQSVFNRDEPQYEVYVLKSYF